MFVFLFSPCSTQTLTRSFLHQSKVCGQLLEVHCGRGLRRGMLVVTVGLTVAQRRKFELVTQSRDGCIAQKTLGNEDREKPKYFLLNFWCQTFPCFLSPTAKQPPGVNRQARPPTLDKYGGSEQ